MEKSLFLSTCLATSTIRLLWKESYCECPRRNIHLYQAGKRMPYYATYRLCKIRPTRSAKSIHTMRMRNVHCSLRTISTIGNSIGISIRSVLNKRCVGVCAWKRECDSTAQPNRIFAPEKSIIFVNRMVFESNPTGRYVCADIWKRDS